MFDNEVRVNVTQCTHHVTDDRNVVLTAVLGSCVAVCAYDLRTGVGGMNHILLPGNRDGGVTDSSGMYGVNLMELLLNDLFKKGVRRRELKFKMFGGSKLLKTGLDAGDRNIDFVLEFARNEGFDVVSKSLGGTSGRQIEFHPATGRTRQKLLDKDMPVQTEPVVPAPRPEAGAIELF